MTKEQIRLCVETLWKTRISKEVAKAALALQDYAGYKTDFDVARKSFVTAVKYCDDPDNCTYSDCPTAFCDRGTEVKKYAD